MQAIVNEDKTYSLVIDEDKINLGDKTESQDIIPTGPNSFNLIRNNKVYNIEIVSKEGKQYSLKVNGIPYEVQLKDRLDETLSKMGIDQVSQHVANDLKAPMPGLILDVMVNAGQEVTKDQPLLILEAMKMENIIKSPSDGTVSEVLIETGASVEKNKVLIRF